MKRFFIVICSFLLCVCASAEVRVEALMTEHMVNPMSIDTPTPRLGWRIVSDKKGVMQKEYHIIVSSTCEKAEHCDGDLWDATVSTDQSQWIPYGGKRLRSNTRCWWRVKVKTTKGASSWSDIAMWNVGLLQEGDWAGQWIGLDHAMPWDVEEIHSRLSARYLRTTFSVDKPVRQATLYICGLGMYEVYVNGNKIGNQVLAPAPTDYRRTVLYNAFDVTDEIAADNALSVVLGNGRYYTMQQKKKPYKILNFGYPKMRLNLIIEYLDGSRKVVASNERWRLNPDGAIRSNNEYDGEIYDARKEFVGWQKVGFDDSSWMRAERVAIPTGTLRGAMAENMQVVKTLPVKEITHKDGKSVIDFGQNTAGWVKFRVPKMKKGDTLRVRYAEKLDADGTLYVANLRQSQTTDHYISNGKDAGQWWSPKFSYHGFRFVEVNSAAVGAADFVAEVISDAMAETGTFRSDNDILNKVYHNACWGILSNYKGMPVDCPQRDERQPWLGDRTGGCYGEAFIFDNNNFYAKWNRDIVEAQREDGCIPDVAPAFWNYYSDNMTWPAALPFSMQMMYRQYGNDAPIRKYYPAVKLWLSHMKDRYGRDGLMTKDKYGDWCTVPEKLELIHSKDPKRITDGTLIATAYYFRCCKVMEEFAHLLGNTADADFYAGEAETTKAAFNRTFLHIAKGTSDVAGHILHPDSTFYGNNTVTANVLPLAFGMIDDDYVRGEVEKNIVKVIMSDNGGHLCCGVIGIQWLMQELRNMGRGDIAWLLATRKDYPSWGYMAQNGATTIWELWNGNTANPAMNSGNHVMLLGDLVTWLYQDLGGIRSAAAGFREIELRPDFSVDEMDNMDVSYDCIYGKITSRWTKADGILSWHIEIPCNTTAKAYLPDGTVKTLESGSYDLTCPVAHPQACVYDVPGTPEKVLHGKVMPSPVLKDEFLYKHTTFPECHSSTIAEISDGSLVATYFGGTKERNPDVCIWVSRKEKGSDMWTAPQMVADGVMNDTLRYACWNPVVYELSKGNLVIYFKIGPNVAGWTGWYCTSSDNGRTWSSRQPLQEGFLGPVKNKPVLSHGRLIAPTSLERGGWRIYFEYSDDMGKTWQRTDDVKAEKDVNTDKPVLAIQPSIITLPDGTLKALCRTRSGRVGTSQSSDNGLTWSKLTLSDIPNNNSGLDAVTLRDGGYALICNDWPIKEKTQKGDRNPLSILISRDGQHWQHWVTLEDSPVSQYSYPSIIQTSDGHLHAIYTWRRQRIKHVELLPPTELLKK